MPLLCVLNECFRTFFHSKIKVFSLLWMEKPIHFDWSIRSIVISIAWAYHVCVFLFCSLVSLIFMWINCLFICPRCAFLSAFEPIKKSSKEYASVAFLKTSTRMSILLSLNGMRIHNHTTPNHVQFSSIHFGEAASAAMPVFNAKQNRIPCCAWYAWLGANKHLVGKWI